MNRRYASPPHFFLDFFGMPVARATRSHQNRPHGSTRRDRRKTELPPNRRTVPITPHRAPHENGTRRRSVALQRAQHANAAPTTTGSPTAPSCSERGAWPSRTITNLPWNSAIERAAGRLCEVDHCWSRLPLSVLPAPADRSGRRGLPVGACRAATASSGCSAQSRAAQAVVPN